MKTKTDSSYGIIPIRQTEQGTEVLLIHQYSKIKNHAYWTFPKGHVESGETPQETAARELFEETGLVVDEFISEQTFSTEYTFMWEDTKVNKTASFFVATVQAGEVRTQEAEVKDAVWLPITAVAERLDYQTSKDMFAAVVTFLNKHTTK